MAPDQTWPQLVSVVTRAPTASIADGEGAEEETKAEDESRGEGGRETRTKAEDESRAAGAAAQSQCSPPPWRWRKRVWRADGEEEVGAEVGHGVEDVETLRAQLRGLWRKVGVRDVADDDNKLAEALCAVSGKRTLMGLEPSVEDALSRIVREECVCLEIECERLSKERSRGRFSNCCGAGSMWTSEAYVPVRREIMRR